MSDDLEERRLQDQRDLEFFSKRIRPTVGDLLRTNELSKNNNQISLEPDEADRQRLKGLNVPATLVDIYANRRRTTDYFRAYATDRGATNAKTEILWLVVAITVVLLAAWTSSPIRIVEAIVF